MRERERIRACCGGVEAVAVEELRRSKHLARICCSIDGPLNERLEMMDDGPLKTQSKEREGEMKL